MDSVDNFKRVIQEYLNSYALSDMEFSEKMENPDKSLDKCIAYIIDMVKKANRIAFSQEEIYGLALHYYDEKDIDDKIPGNISCTIVSPYIAEITDEDKALAKQQAIQQLVEEEKKKIKPSTPKAKLVQQTQPSLFDF